MIQVSQFKTIIELVNRFPNEKSCHQYLAGQRWNGYLECPHEGCTGDTAYVFKDGIRYKCKKCNRQYTAKTGTIFEGSHIDMQKWMIAIWLFMHKKGISSIQLSKDIGITQKSAWFLLHRIRTVLGNEPQQQLENTVEIDESFIGGKAKNKHKNKRPKYNPGRGWKDKTPVFGAIQRAEIEIIERPHKVIPNQTVKEKIIITPSHLKAFKIPDVLMLTIKKASIQHIKGGSTIYGDGFNGYRALHAYFDVSCVDHGRGYYVDGDCHTNTLEGAWKQLKLTIQATYHQVTPKHLNNYLNEFTYRYNYRNLNIQQQIEKVIANMGCRLKYKELIKS